MIWLVDSDKLSVLFFCMAGKRNLIGGILEWDGSYLKKEVKESSIMIEKNLMKFSRR